MVENNKIKELLKELHVGHMDHDDPCYACPLSDSYRKFFVDKRGASFMAKAVPLKCDCGADALNARVANLVELLECDCGADELNARVAKLFEPGEKL